MMGDQSSERINHPKVEAVLGGNKTKLHLILIQKIELRIGLFSLDDRLFLAPHRVVRDNHTKGSFQIEPGARMFGL